MISSLVLRDSALAMLTICWIAVLCMLSWAVTSMSTPSSKSAALAFLFMVSQSIIPFFLGVFPR